MAFWEFTDRLWRTVATSTTAFVLVRVHQLSFFFEFVHLQSGISEGVLCESFGQSSFYASPDCHHPLPTSGLEIPLKCFKGQNNQTVFTPRGTYCHPDVCGRFQHNPWPRTVAFSFWNITTLDADISTFLYFFLLLVFICELKMLTTEFRSARGRVKKGWGSDESHVMQTQEMNHQWTRWVHEQSIHSDCWS